MLKQVMVRLLLTLSTGAIPRIILKEIWLALGRNSRINLKSISSSSMVNLGKQFRELFSQAWSKVWISELEDLRV
jgi:ubiquinone biosynthesis protein Coq4